MIKRVFMDVRLGPLLLVIGLEVYGSKQRISTKRQPAVKINAGHIVGVIRVRQCGCNASLSTSYMHNEVC